MVHVNTASTPPSDNDDNKKKTATVVVATLKVAVEKVRRCSFLKRTREEEEDEKKLIEVRSNGSREGRNMTSSLSFHALPKELADTIVLSKARALPPHLPELRPPPLSVQCSLPHLTSPFRPRPTTPAKRKRRNISSALTKFAEWTERNKDVSNRKKSPISASV